MSAERLCNHFPAQWIDEPPSNGRVRTICKCGKWIGYRPDWLDADNARREERRRQRLLKQGRKVEDDEKFWGASDL